MPSFSEPALSVRRNRHRDHRIGKHHGLERRRIFLICQRVARARVLQAKQSNNVSGLSGILLLTTIGVHLDDAADALGLAGKRIDDRVALFQAARVNARKRQRAKAVVHDLEGERTQRTIGIDDSDVA